MTKPIPPIWWNIFAKATHVFTSQDPSDFAGAQNYPHAYRSFESQGWRFELGYEQAYDRRWAGIIGAKVTNTHLELQGELSGGRDDTLSPTSHTTGITAFVKQDIARAIDPETDIKAFFASAGVGPTYNWTTGKFDMSAEARVELLLPFNWGSQYISNVGLFLGAIKYGIFDKEDDIFGKVAWNGGISFGFGRGNEEYIDNNFPIILD